MSGDEPRSEAPGQARIERIELGRDEHRTALRALLDEYARSPQGGGRPLDARVLEDLPDLLARCPGYVGLIALLDGEAVGLANCFESVSTFRAQPLLNVHDLVVRGDHRRRGIGSMLLAAAEALARARGCCKLTLEVLEGNSVAIAAYRKAGFAGYQLDPALGRAVLLEKKFY